MNGRVNSLVVQPDQRTLRVTCTVFPSQPGAPSQQMTLELTRPDSATQRTRKNIYALTTEERQAFLKALDVTKRFGVYDSFIQAHLDVSSDRPMVSMTTDAHNSPTFLVWHRQFLDLYERSLIASGFPIHLGAPYWNWEADPHVDGDCMWTAQFFGNRFGSVKSGVLGTWQGYGDDHRTPATRWILRNDELEKDIKEKAAKENARVRKNGRESTFPEIRKRIEAAHNVGHMILGGDMDTFASPNDPLFFAVHSRTEKYYLEWQTGQLSDNTTPTHALQFVGKNRKGSPVSLEDKLSPWGLQVKHYIAPPTDIVYDNNCDTPLCKTCVP